MKIYKKIIGTKWSGEELKRNNFQYFSKNSVRFASEGKLSLFLRR